MAFLATFSGSKGFIIVTHLLRFRRKLKELKDKLKKESARCSERKTRSLVKRSSSATTPLSQALTEEELLLSLEPKVPTTRGDG